MGVYYPPHLILYGLLPTEQAYVASLVLHTLWGALGAWWAARRFGVSAAGFRAGGILLLGVGFFVIHMPHPWGYTTGSWMPWAWGLAWSILNAREPYPVGGSSASAWCSFFNCCPGIFSSPSSPRSASP